MGEGEERMYLYNIIISLMDTASVKDKSMLFLIQVWNMIICYTMFPALSFITSVPENSLSNMSKWLINSCMTMRAWVWKSEVKRA